MPIIELTDKHRKRLKAYIDYFADKGYLFENICERCNIIKGNADYDTDLIVGFSNAELCFEKEKLMADLFLLDCGDSFKNSIQ